jgi:hypothetical protein
LRSPGVTFDGLNVGGSPRARVTFADGSGVTFFFAANEYDPAEFERAVKRAIDQANHDPGDEDRTC